MGDPNAPHAPHGAYAMQVVVLVMDQSQFLHDWDQTRLVGDANDVAGGVVPVPHFDQRRLDGRYFGTGRAHFSFSPASKAR